MLESIRRRRDRRASPFLGSAIERAIIQRELDELEAEWLLSPPVPQGDNGPVEPE